MSKVMQEITDLNAEARTLSFETNTVPTNASPPSAPVNGDVWHNKDSGDTYVYYIDQWVSIGGSAK
jgi:hypothetical protein